MFSRRGFLIGTGSLLTAAFVKDARSFVSTTHEPLLVAPPQVAQTLYWYEKAEQGFGLALGLPEDRPPPPTWREYFIREAIAHETDDEACLVRGDYGIEPGHYDDPIDEWIWEYELDYENSSWAKAYRLLDSLDLGPTLARPSERTHLLFCEGDLSNADRRWVDASDKLALSLLQARLIDLKLPIRIAKGT
jgi:hypothetical protein